MSVSIDTDGAPDSDVEPFTSRPERFRAESDSEAHDSDVSTDAGMSVSRFFSKRI